MVAVVVIEVVPGPADNRQVVAKASAADDQAPVVAYIVDLAVAEDGRAGQNAACLPGKFAGEVVDSEIHLGPEVASEEEGTSGQSPQA